MRDTHEQSVVMFSSSQQTLFGEALCLEWCRNMSYNYCIKFSTVNQSASADGVAELPFMHRTFSIS